MFGKKPKYPVYGPSFVVELGNALYVCDFYDEDSDTRKAAERVVKEFEAMSENLPKNSPERIYMEKLLACAVQFATGKGRRKREYEKKKERAGDSHKLKIEKIIKRGSTLDIIQTVLFGAGGFAAMGCISRAIGIELDPVTEAYASSAIGAFSAIGVLEFNRRRLQRKIEMLEKSYAEKISNLELEYRDGIREECVIVLQRAREAWLESFEEEPREFVDIAKLVDKLKL